MGGRKDKAKRQFEQGSRFNWNSIMDGNPDQFFPLFCSQMDSAAFNDLSTKQQLLYIRMREHCMKAKFRKRMADPDRSNPAQFYFNKAVWAGIYRLYGETCNRQFEKDRDALILHGFIVCVECGRNTRTRSIYQFVDGWQKWPEYTPPTSVMSASLLRQYREEREG